MVHHLIHDGVQTCCCFREENRPRTRLHLRVNHASADQRGRGVTVPTALPAEGERIFSSACAISLACAKRRCLSLARHLARQRWMVCTKSGARSGHSREIAGGSCVSTAVITARGVAPRNGGCPDSKWYRVAPKLKRSARPSRSSQPRACSGDIYQESPRSGPGASAGLPVPHAGPTQGPRP